MRRVAILAFDGFQPLDVVGPFDVFHGANQAAGRAVYDVVVAAPLRGAVRAENRLVLHAGASLRSIAKHKLDTLLVSGGAGTRRAVDDPALVAQVRAAASHARRVTSVCTGSFLLAAAGVLDGKRATTHWAFCDSLARRFPRVHVDGDPIYVRDGRVWTSAGVTAGIDLALALVEEDLGRDTAMLVARWMVVFVRRAGGQSQFSPALAAQAAEQRPRNEIDHLVGDIAAHPDHDLTVPRLARRVSMSVRNFTRVFREHTGASPAQFVLRVRVDAARRLLEDSARSVDDVATRTGFGTPESLRRAFSRVVGVSPTEYRARFGTARATSR